MPINLFEPVQAIIDRILDLETDLQTVNSVSTLYQSVEEMTRMLPGAFVRPVSSQAMHNPGNFNLLKDEHQYQVIVAVEHSSNSEDLTETTAGELCGRILDALDNWRPGVNWEPLLYTGYAETQYMPGYAEFPINFSTRLTLTKR
jgi:hypothetical protein